MTKIIGLTGGIGSGKTTIAKYFEAKGIPVYIADEKAKILTNDPKVLELIKKEFGASIFDNDILNRKKLSAIVFNNQKKLEQLNKIIHPLVKKDFDKWLENHSKSEYIVKESAILFESNSYLDCYIIIAIICPIEIRLERVLSRDNITKEQILLKIKAQISEKELIVKSDYIINNIDLNISKMQVDKFLKLLNFK